MAKDVTLSLRVPGSLRDEINEDAGNSGLNQSEWLRQAVEYYLTVGDNPGDLMLDAEEIFYVLKKHIKNLENLIDDADLSDEDQEYFEKMMEDFDDDLTIIEDRFNDLDEDDESYDDDLNAIEDQAVYLLNAVNSEIRRLEVDDENPDDEDPDDEDPDDEDPDDEDEDE